jgi:hypothetical protein
MEITGQTPPQKADLITINALQKLHLSTHCVLHIIHTLRCVIWSYCAQFYHPEFFLQFSNFAQPQSVCLLLFNIWQGVCFSFG